MELLKTNEFLLLAPQIDLKNLTKLPVADWQRDCTFHSPNSMLESIFWRYCWRKNGIRSAQKKYTGDRTFDWWLFRSRHENVVSWSIDGTNTIYSIGGNGVDWCERCPACKFPRLYECAEKSPCQCVTKRFSSIRKVGLYLWIRCWRMNCLFDKKPKQLK